MQSSLWYAFDYFVTLAEIFAEFCRKFTTDPDLKAIGGANEKKMLKFAQQYLGIDPQTEGGILWLAKKCMHTPLPKGWREFSDSDGNSYFRHEAKDETSWDQKRRKEYQRHIDAVNQQFADWVEDTHGWKIVMN